MAFIGNQPYQVAFVTDTFSGNASTTAFTMSVAPANTSSVLVAVTGVLQDPSTYSVSGTTLTFSAAPPTGTGNISVRYLGIPASGVTTTAYRTVTQFTATAGQTTFSPPSYTAGFINVYRNGVLLGTADYTATNGTTVVLASGATVGDLVTVESFLVSSVLNAIPATAGSVSTAYLVDGSVTQAKLSTNVAGNGPAFSVYRGSSDQSISSSTATKVQLNTKEFDTNSNFDSVTNYRFTPTVAGYYQINGQIEGAGTSVTRVFASIYKNGSLYKMSNDGTMTAAYRAFVASVVYLNGSTDYVELYGWVNGSSTVFYNSNGNGCYLNGALVRSA